jgi:type IV secretory pathway VirD2 relaxase
MDATTVRTLVRLRERRDAALDLAYRPGTGALRRASALDEAHALALAEAAVIGELAERERETATRKRADLSAAFTDDGMVYVPGRGRIRRGGTVDWDDR